MSKHHCNASKNSIIKYISQVDGSFLVLIFKIRAGMCKHNKLKMYAVLEI